MFPCSAKSGVCLDVVNGFTHSLRNEKSVGDKSGSSQTSQLSKEQVGGFFCGFVFNLREKGYKI